MRTTDSPATSPLNGVYLEAWELLATAAVMGLKIPPIPHQTVWTTTVEVFDTNYIDQHVIAVTTTEATALAAARHYLETHPETIEPRKYTPPPFYQIQEDDEYQYHELNTCFENIIVFFNETNLVGETQ